MIVGELKMFEYKGKTIDRAKLTTQELEDLKQEMSDTVQYLSGMLYAVTSDLNDREVKQNEDRPI